MPDYLGDDMRKTKKDEPEKEEKEIKCKYELRYPMVDDIIRNFNYLVFCTALDEADIALLKTYVS